MARGEVQWQHQEREEEAPQETEHARDETRQLCWREAVTLHRARRGLPVGAAAAEKLLKKEIGGSYEEMRIKQIRMSVKLLVPTRAKLS